MKVLCSAMRTLTDVPRLLTLVERRVTERLAAALAAVGTTVEEYRVLALLADGRGHAMSELGEQALLPPPSVTKVVDRLVAANLVYRRPDEIDRRRVLAYLSERGATAARRATAPAAEVDRDLTALLGDDDTVRLTALLGLLS